MHTQQLFATKVVVPVPLYISPELIAKRFTRFRRERNFDLRFIYKSLNVPPCLAMARTYIAASDSEEIPDEKKKQALKCGRESGVLQELWICLIVFDKLREKSYRWGKP